MGFPFWSFDNADVRSHINAMSQRQSAHIPLCPICRKPRAEEFRPFCSRRCADIDLNRWFSGVYAVPTKDDEDEDGAAPPADER
jgi:uncharacterized protein